MSMTLFRSGTWIGSMSSELGKIPIDQSDLSQCIIGKTWVLGQGKSSKLRQPMKRACLDCLRVGLDNLVYQLPHPDHLRILVLAKRAPGSVPRYWGTQFIVVFISITNGSSQHAFQYNLLVKDTAYCHWNVRSQALSPIRFLQEAELKTGAKQYSAQMIRA